MRVTTYAYPWDLARLGVERALDEIRSCGIDAIDLASTYHPIDTLSPRDGSPRLFTNARGAVYFPARTERYGRIQPAVAAPEICAVWPEAAAHVSKLDLEINAWTITLYQPWIVDAHPECARTLPSGDPIGSGVCPASDDFREYFAALCEDIVDQFAVNMIRLEGLAAPTYDYGWLRPRVLVEVSPLASELLAICFCASCRRRGIDEGLDVEALRERVNDAIVAELEGDQDAGRMRDRSAALAADGELHAFLVQHEQASVELARIAISRVDASKVPRLSTMVWTPYSLLLDDRTRGDLQDELALAVGQLVGVSTQDAQRLRSSPALAARPIEFGVLLAPLHSPATAAGAERIERGLRGAAELGASEISLYNFGLLRENDVRDLVTAVRTPRTSRLERDPERRASRRAAEGIPPPSECDKGSS